MADSKLVPIKKTSSDIVLIQPSKKWVPLDWKELWRYRELIYFLTWRGIKVRYAQTLLGFSWVIIQPIMNMVVLNFLFGNIANIPTDGIPRPIFTLSGVLIWGLFSRGIGDAGRSMVANRNMITKIYFPRLILPFSSVLSGLFDFVISFAILIGMMVWYKIVPTSNIWTLPLFMLLAIITSLGVGLWLAPLNVHYRDIRYIIPFITQMWMFITPVAYPASEIPDAMRTIYALNPMVGVVEGFRWALLGNEARPGPEIWISIVIGVVLFITGLYYFRKMERTFADMV